MISDKKSDHKSDIIRTRN